jgi:hypothetical protein
MLPPIPEPVLLNCWKHHLGFIIDRIRDYNSKIFLNNLKEDLLNIGNSTTDLYTGNIDPYESASLAINEIRKMGFLDTDKFKQWINETPEAYRCYKYPDESVWVFRIGTESARYIHIHPGRNVPHTLRVKATILKTAIGAVTLARINQADPFSLPVINEARESLAGLSPVKSILPGSEFVKILEIIFKRVKE